MQRRGLGWCKDLRDDRDFAVGGVPPSIALPTNVDLRLLYSPPIEDQSVTNSCVGNATSSVFRFMRCKLGLPDIKPSRLFTYYFARARQGWQNEDEGCMPRDAMQSLISNGTVDEAVWPFITDPAVVNQRPPQTVLAQAKHNHIVEHKYVRMLPDHELFHLKYSLAQELPFVLGIPCFSSFFDVGSNGIVPMPKKGETLEGFHLMYALGYDDHEQYFITPNSWGEEDGDHGVRYLPYEFMKRYADDLWRMELVT